MESRVLPLSDSLPYWGPAAFYCEEIERANETLFSESQGGQKMHLKFSSPDHTTFWRSISRHGLMAVVALWCRAIHCWYCERGVRRRRNLASPKSPGQHLFRWFCFLPNSIDRGAHKEWYIAALPFCTDTLDNDWESFDVRSWPRGKYMVNSSKKLISTFSRTIFSFICPMPFNFFSKIQWQIFHSIVTKQLAFQALKNDPDWRDEEHICDARKSVCRSA